MSLRVKIKDYTYWMVTELYGDHDGTVALPILFGPARGLKIRADLAKRKDAYFWGKYDRHVLNVIMPLVRPGWTIWDCGIYIGFYTLFFARRVGPAGRVLAIELDYRNLNRTQENAALNQLSNIEFVNAAIGAPSGEVEFIMDDGTNSHLVGTYVGGLEMRELWQARDKKKNCGRVECISLDQVLLEKGFSKPDLIKLDIEGAEKEALQHADYIFGEVRPLLLLELHNPQCDHAAWDFSQRFGYDLRCLDTGEIPAKLEDVHGTLLCQPR